MMVYVTKNFNPPWRVLISWPADPHWHLEHQTGQEYRTFSISTLVQTEEKFIIGKIIKIGKLTGN
jgi:hypothetical protein